MLDSLTVLILGLVLLSGQVQGVQMGPLNIGVGVAVILSSLLLLLEDLRVLPGQCSQSGWLLLVVALVVFAIANL